MKCYDARWRSLIEWMWFWLNVLYVVWDFCSQNNVRFVVGHFKSLMCDVLHCFYKCSWRFLLETWSNNHITSTGIFLIILLVLSSVYFYFACLKLLCVLNWTFLGSSLDLICREQFFVSVSINTVCTSLYKSGICRFLGLCYVTVYVTGRRWRCKLKRRQKFLLSQKVNDAGHVEIIISYFFTRTGDAFAVLSCSRQLH